MVATMVAFVSCTSYEPFGQSGKPVTISFATSGDLQVDVTPLTKATATESRDLYGIQVYKLVDGSKIGYAYGLFDDLSYAAITMYTDEVYKVEAAYIPNGKDIVKLVDGTEDYGCWEVPFNQSQWDKVAINQFTYISNANLFALTMARVVRDGEQRADGYHRSGINYFAGVVEEYAPSETSPTLTVEMLRENFGFEFKFKSSEYTRYDKVLIQIDPDATYAHESFYVDIDQTKEYSAITISPILMGRGLGHDNVSVCIGTDDNNYEFYNGKIRVERNKMYHITVTPPEGTIGGAISLSVDNTAMADENTTI